jgi:hypothetical protein
MVGCLGAPGAAKKPKKSEKKVKNKAPFKGLFSEN